MTDKLELATGALGIKGLSLWKIIIPLAIQFLGVVWVARGVVMQVENNTEMNRILVKKELERGSKLTEVKTRMDEMSKRFQRFEAYLVRLDERLVNVLEDKGRN